MREEAADVGDDVGRVVAPEDEQAAERVVVVHAHPGLHEHAVQVAREPEIWQANKTLLNSWLGML